MKKNIFWILFLILKIGQAQTIDSAYIKCNYKLTYIPDSTKPGKKKTDIMTLMIGKKTSTFFSYSNFIADSMIKADIEGNPVAIQEMAKNLDFRKKYTSPGFFSYYQLFINFPKNKITITDKIANNNYVYEEFKEQIKWKVFPDSLTILDFHCQKATAFYRGRQYEAWFTLEIPINAGPYKFAGLPGLIVKISDTKNNYVYECISVEHLTKMEAITIPQKQYIKTSREEFRKAFQASFDNPYQTITANGNVTYSGAGADKLKELLQRGIPYNPIELK